MSGTLRRHIPPPDNLDPRLAEFVAELARATVRRQMRARQSEALVASDEASNG